MGKDRAYYDKLTDEYNMLLSTASAPSGMTLMFRRDSSTQRAIVAEGDSWFDYGHGLIRIGKDIVHQLVTEHGYRISNIAEAGDTLDNMVYGTRIDRKFQPKQSQWEETKRAIEELHPDVFLFSGGGNDFSGPELGAKVNHRLSGDNLIRQGVVDYVFGEVVPSAFRCLFQKVWAIDDQIDIIIHGYANPRPDGRGIRLWGIPKTWAGPWLRPYLARRGITDAAERQEIVTALVGLFNDALRALADMDSRVHYLDLRPLIEWRDWENELHLKDQGFAKVAAKFDATIRAVRGARSG